MLYIGQTSVVLKQRKQKKALIKLRKNNEPKTNF